ncbi:MAG: hypothetical protein Q9226_003880 [Calogaya cf. arnoldii]
MTLQAIKYSRGKLQILDQLRLPHHEVYIDIKSPEDAWDAIKSMQVRGAPAIAIVAALSIAVRVAHSIDSRHEPLAQRAKDAATMIIDSLDYLVTSRPTAVNLADAAAKLRAVVSTAVNNSQADSCAVMTAYIQAAERMLIDDVQDNERIGKHGAEWLLRHTTPSSSDSMVSVMTHCNTGSLATAGYGTALGVIRSLHSSNSLRHVYYTETRPYNQGARLTGYELIHDGLPATLITDSMAAALMRTKGRSENITAVVVGADRVAANGDTANKIGTYALAVLAKYHGLKFLVAAPRTTVDVSTKSGADIVIEERPEIEVVNIKGPVIRTNGSSDEKDIIKGSTQEICIAASGARAWNPAFDVTPAELIDGIVTEQGVVEKDSRGVFQWEDVFNVDVLEKAPKVGKAKTINMLPDGITPQVPLNDQPSIIETDSVLSRKLELQRSR